MMCIFWERVDFVIVYLCAYLSLHYGRVGFSFWKCVPSQGDRLHAHGISRWFCPIYFVRTASAMGEVNTNFTYDYCVPNLTWWCWWIVIIHFNYMSVMGWVLLRLIFWLLLKIGRFYGSSSYITYHTYTS